MTLIVIVEINGRRLWLLHVSPKRCKTGGKLVIIMNRKSYMSFRLVPKSVNDSHVLFNLIVSKENNNNNNIHICIAPYGRNFRGAGPGSVLVGVRRGKRVKRVSLGEEKCL